MARCLSGFRPADRSAVIAALMHPPGICSPTKSERFFKSCSVISCATAPADGQMILAFAAIFQVNCRGTVGMSVIPS